MIYALAAIFILALIRGGDKFLLYGAFAVFMAVNNCFEKYISDENFAVYYLLDATLLLMLSQVFEFSRKHAIYNFILSIGVVINGAGYLMWYNFIPPDLYNLTYLGLYSYTIIILMSGAAYDAGNRAALSFFNGVCDFIDKNHLRHMVKTERSNT